MLGEMSTPEGKSTTPERRIGVGSLSAEKYKWHFDKALGAKNTSDAVHNGERGF
jgi:hypothetical protein